MQKNRWRMLGTFSHLRMRHIASAFSTIVQSSSLRTGPALRASAVFAAVAMLVASHGLAQSSSTYVIHWSTISQVVQPSRNNCFILTGVVGQPAPGYSHTTIYTIYALVGGYFAPTSAIRRDEISYSGFEDCGS